MRDATKLRIYFNDDKALFLIPLYQRKYAWQKKHCQRLLSDLQKIHEKNITSHFFGSIVSVKEEYYKPFLRKHRFGKSQRNGE